LHLAINLYTFVALKQFEMTLGLRNINSRQLSPDMNSGNDMPDKRSTKSLVMTPSMLTDGRASFSYSYRNANSNPNFLQDLKVNWLAFSNQVNNLNNSQPVPLTAERIALRFIHRFNMQNQRWYLTCQLCGIVGAPLPDADVTRRHETYVLNPLPLYFDITTDGQIVNNGSNGLGGDVSSHWGVDYFDNVFFGANKVMKGVNVQSCTMPWHEISKLFTDNLTQDRPIQAQFEIAFTSTSHYVDLPSNDCNVNYPHSLAVYMCYANTNCLEQGDIILGNFKNKAANFTTNCPSKCNVLVWNADMPRPE
jgi:hypothetical protein